MRTEYYISFIVIFIFGSVTSESCDKLDGKDLINGCSSIKGLSIISQGGTLVNDSNCDVLLPKLIFAKEPKILFNKSDEKKTYTAIIIDPDAPNHTPGNFYLHMIKSNIPGSSLNNGDLKQGIDVKNYIGPGPPKGTGDHRYIFLIYEQKTNDLKMVAPEIRARFNVNDWMKDIPLCGPIAGVQFRARFEL